MIDWEADLADHILDLDGRPAVYVSPDEQTTLQFDVLFNHRFIALSPMGQPHNAMKAEALGKISALDVVRKHGHLTVAGKRWLITEMPQPDGTCWTTLILGEADE